MIGRRSMRLACCRTCRGCGARASDGHGPRRRSRRAGAAMRPRTPWRARARIPSMWLRTIRADDPRRARASKSRRAASAISRCWSPSTSAGTSTTSATPTYSAGATTHARETVRPASSRHLHCQVATPVTPTGQRSTCLPTDLSWQTTSTSPSSTSTPRRSSRWCS